MNGNRALARDSRYPGFAREVRGCLKNLFFDFFFRTIFGDFFNLIADRDDNIDFWDRYTCYRENPYGSQIHDLAVVGKNVFLRSIGEDGGPPVWRKNSILFALPFTVFMGLLALPFTILRTAIKLILIVPRLCILRAEDHLLKRANLEEVIEFASKTVLNELLYECAKAFLDDLIRNAEVDVSDALETTANAEDFVENTQAKGMSLYLIESKKFINTNSLPKCLFGPGHFIYMALYHLAFAAALASIPILLHKFDKLPNIIPHVPTLSLSLGLIALLFISFMALNIIQCLKINEIGLDFLNVHPGEYRYFCKKICAILCHYSNDQRSDEAKATEHFIGLIEEIRQLKENISSMAEHIHFGSAIDEMKKKEQVLIHEAIKFLNLTLLEEEDIITLFPITASRILATPILCSRLRCGDGCGRYDQIAYDLTGRGLPIFDAYDGTTDLGFGVDVLTTALPSAILRAVRVNSPFDAEKRESKLWYDRISSRRE